MIVGFKIKRKGNVGKETKKCAINELEQDTLKRIFSYLNVIELTVIMRVCPKWKRFIEKEKDILTAIDLSTLPKKASTLNFIKIISKSTSLKRLTLPENVSNTDTLSFLLSVPSCVEYLRVTNLNIECANVFSRLTLPNVTKLDLTGRIPRRKEFDNNEIKALTNCFKNLREINLSGLPLTEEVIFAVIVRVKSLESLSLLECPQMGNMLFAIIKKYTTTLKRLEIGGNPTNYNNNYSLEGIEKLCQADCPFESIKISYCSKLGDASIEALVTAFKSTLKELHVIRNCYEKCSKITDKSAEILTKATNLEQLSFVYIRSFDEMFHVHIASLRNLRVLNLRECPLQEDFSILNEGCPNLEEVNLSGNSWVRTKTVHGLSKHKNLKIFHLGHVEHAEGQCDKDLGEFPPRGMFLEALLKKEEAFPNLRVLYLEQICGLTYWLDVRFKKIRPNLEIRYTPYENFFQLAGGQFD